MALRERTTVEDIASLFRQNRELAKQDFAIEFENLKESIRQETVLQVTELLDIRLDQLQQTVQSNSNAIAKIPDEIEQRMSSIKGNGKRTKSQRDAEKDVPEIKCILDKDRIIWAILVQLLRGSAFDLKLVLDTRNEQRDSISFVNTLSSFLFAIKGQEKKSLHESMLGRGAGIIVRDVVFRLFWSARRGSLFKVNQESITDLRRVIPSWLAIHADSAVREVLQGLGELEGLEVERANTTGPCEKGTFAILWAQKNLSTEQLKEVHRVESNLLKKDIEDCITEMESYRVMVGEGSKRYKKATNGESASYPGHDMFRKAVCAARTAVLIQLNEGRNRARDSVFRAFGFILEIMLGVNGVSKSGFGIKIPEVTEKEIRAHETLQEIGKIVGESVVVSGSASELEKGKAGDTNDATLKGIIAKFPFLSCTVTYKLKYNPEEDKGTSQQDSAMDTSEESNTAAPSTSANAQTAATVEWDVTEVISLHKVALDFLFEAVRAGSDKYVLRVCKESLKAVQCTVMRLH